MVIIYCEYLLCNDEKYAYFHHIKISKNTEDLFCEFTFSILYWDYQIILIALSNYKLVSNHPNN